MRLLLDEGFPSPPGFKPEMVDANVQVVPLRAFDPVLVGIGTPDWYLYLRADEAGFDALVTRDWHQSQQPEELFALMSTELSVVTWKKPLDDPVREWGQLLAYLPEIRRLINELGASIIFLPSPKLRKTANTTKASQEIGALASDLGMSNAQLRDQARAVIRDDLSDRRELKRFGRLKM